MSTATAPDSAADLHGDNLTGSEDPDGSVRIVKRYANRKLYDTTESRYVTLQQIAKLVREGEDVRIIDNRTKDDLTDVTLAQIIYEEHKKGGATPRAARTLRSLIQRGGERIITSLREGPALGQGERWKGLIAQSKEAWDELYHSADDQMRSLLGRVEGPLHALHHEVARLQARIEELEDKLHRASQPRQSRTGMEGEGGSASEREDDISS